MMKISEVKIPLMKGKKSYWSNGEPKGAVKAFFQQLVEEGCFTVKEIQDAMRQRYPEIKKNTVTGYPRHATNMNGCDRDKSRFPYKAIITPKGIIKFDRKTPKGSW